MDGTILIPLMQSKVSDFVMAYDLTIMNPMLLSGLFIGVMGSFYFSGLTMKAVGRAAARMVVRIVCSRWRTSSGKSWK